MNRPNDRSIKITSTRMIREDISKERTSGNFSPRKFIEQYWCLKPGHRNVVFNPENSAASQIRIRFGSCKWRRRWRWEPTTRGWNCIQSEERVNKCLIIILFCSRVEKDDIREIYDELSLRTAKYLQTMNAYWFWTEISNSSITLNIDLRKFRRIEIKAIHPIPFGLNNCWKNIETVSIFYQ